MKISVIIAFLFFQSNFGSKVITKTGNKFHGSIKSLTQEKIVIDTDYGELKIPIEEVEEIKSEKLFFYTKDKKTYNLPITGFDAEKMIVYTPSLALPLREVTEASFKKKKITGMDFNAGLGLSTGNSESQSYSLGLRFYLKPSSHFLSLSANTNYSIQSGEKSVDYQRLNLDYTYTLWNGVTFSITNLSERDGIANLDLRLVDSGKTGYSFNTFNGVKISISGGASFFYEDFKSASPSSELRLIITGNLNSSSSNLKVDFENSAFISPDEPSKFLVQSQLSLTSTLNRFFSLFISILDSYNNRPLVEIKKNDLILNAGFSFSI